MDCQDAPDSALFQHVKTTDSVADMESLRIALGQKKINYYGFSYGTYLGSVYMTLHPTRVGNFVLDSTVDPQRVFYKSNLDQDRAFQKTSTSTSPGWRSTTASTTSVRPRRRSGPTTPGGDNGYAIYLGTQCTDAPWPKSQTKLDQDSYQLVSQGYNYFTWSNAWFNGPCAYWKFKAHQPVTVTGAKVTTPILMIDETYDAATPYPGSLVVRKLFPTASLIEGLNGSTHAGTLSGVACTDDTIATYLLTGKVPPRKSGNRSHKICPPVPQPDPTAAAPRPRPRRRARPGPPRSTGSGRALRSTPPTAEHRTRFWSADPS